jgi:predicted N-acetyltransferase YhbS
MGGIPSGSGGSRSSNARVGGLNVENASVGALAGPATADNKTQRKITQPAQLRAGHIISGFNCGEEVHNLWLTKRALPAYAERTANTFVVCRGRRVIGYYSLATASVAHSACTSSLRRNTPDPVPAMILARLAVDLREQGQGIGQDLLFDAQLRVLRAAKHVAARTLLVQALDLHRVEFYRKLGFLPLPNHEGAPLVLHLPLQRIAAAVKQAADNGNKWP